MRIVVVLTADAVAPGQLDGTVALVVDVLRASTTMITALAHGCVSITPVADPAEARRLAAAEGPRAALAAGESPGGPSARLDPRHARGQGALARGAAALRGRPGRRRHRVPALGHALARPGLPPER